MPWCLKNIADTLKDTKIRTHPFHPEHPPSPFNPLRTEGWGTGKGKSSYSLYPGFSPPLTMQQTSFLTEGVWTLPIHVSPRLHIVQSINYKILRLKKLIRVQSFFCFWANYERVKRNINQSTNTIKPTSREVVKTTLLDKELSQCYYTLLSLKQLSQEPPLHRKHLFLAIKYKGQFVISVKKWFSRSYVPSLFASGSFPP